MIHRLPRLLVVAGLAGAVAAWRTRMLAANQAKYFGNQARPGSGPGK